MRVERGYDYEDTCTVSRETMPNYDEKIKSFFEEHIHSDEVYIYIYL
jgi:1,2-dihydroxy-3-keto-5-methylthiopentene dioxygenase